MHHDIRLVRKADHISRFQLSNLRSSDGQLGKDTIVNLALVPLSIKAQTAFEFIAEFFERSDASARCRLSFQETDANPSRGQKRGRCQTADSAADDDNF